MGAVMGTSGNEHIILMENTQEDNTISVGMIMIVVPGWF